MSKLTPKLINDITNLIKRGNYPLVAARACGVKDRTWYDWLERGKGSAKGLYRELFDEVETAQAKPQVTVVNKLYEVAIEGNVRAMELFLSRRYPEQWGAQKQVEVNASPQISFFLPENERD